MLLAASVVAAASVMFFLVPTTDASAAPYDTASIVQYPTAPGATHGLGMGPAPCGGWGVCCATAVGAGRAEGIEPRAEELAVPASPTEPSPRLEQLAVPAPCPDGPRPSIPVYLLTQRLRF
jgi:hypothetical protein